MTPKTVLAIASQVDRCEATLLSSFVKQGIEVILVGDKEQRYQPDLDPKIKIIPLEFKSRFQISAIIKIINLIKTLKPDIVHLFSARSVSNTLIATIGLNTNLVAYRGTMGHLSRLDPSSWLSFLNPKLKKIICVSHAVEKYLWQQGVPSSRTVTIHKGHKFEWYCSPTPLKREQFNIPQNAVVISCVANVRPVKGVDFLIKAFSDINLDNGMLDSVPIYLLLIGELRDDKISNLIQQSPNKQNIICTGFRKDATDVVALADIFVMPSIAREGLPKALIEAMAKGIAPIVGCAK
jgi:glycosyltransferase involved in cell wall biosynthesis